MARTEGIVDYLLVRRRTIFAGPGVAAIAAIAAMPRSTAPLEAALQQEDGSLTVATVDELSNLEPFVMTFINYPMRESVYDQLVRFHYQGRVAGGRRVVGNERGRADADLADPAGRQARLRHRTHRQGRGRRHPASVGRGNGRQPLRLHASGLGRQRTLVTVDEACSPPDGHLTGYARRQEINDTAGCLELAGYESGRIVPIDERVGSPDPALWSTRHGEVLGTIEQETHHFVDCHRVLTSPPVTGKDGRAALHIVLAVEEAVRIGWAVRMEAVSAGSSS